MKSIDKKEDIFELIKSLSKSEKRYFVLFVSRNAVGKQHNSLKLFKAIESLTREKDKKYDKNKLLKKIEGESFTSRLSAEKRCLYNLLLKSLDAYHSDPVHEMNSLLHGVRILYKKGLTNQCLKLLKKVKKMALQDDYFITLLQVYLWEKKIIRTEPESSVLNDKDNQLILAEKKALQNYSDICELDNLVMKVARLNNYDQTPQYSDSIKVFEKIFKHPILGRSDKSLHSFTAKMLYYYIYSQYYLISHKDLNKKYYYCKKLKELCSNKPTFISNNTYNYIVITNNLGLTCLKLRKYEEAFQHLNHLKEIPEILHHSKPDILKLLSFHSIPDFELHYYYLTNQFKKALIILPQIIKDFEKYEKYVDKNTCIELSINIARIYFINEQFRDCLYWVNKILNKKDQNIRLDLQSETKIINLFTHYELRNFEIMESLVRSTSRYLSKNKRLFEIENVILTFFRTNNTNIFDSKERIALFDELKAKIRSIFKKNSDHEFLDYFDIISWLDSKIQNRPFVEVLRENRV
ncbi:MAG: hypothetical protein J5I47_10675 [Vicingus serpentipes]|nr:hypothetical protein [Vicingus serpentipes]